MENAFDAVSQLVIFIASAVCFFILIKTLIPAFSLKLYAENMKAALEAIKALGVSTWAVIHCPEGAFALDERNEYMSTRSLPIPKSDIMGTVGAGDAFCSGVIYGAWKRWTLKESLRLANCCAVAALSERGATEGLASIEEVMKFEQKYPY